MNSVEKFLESSYLAELIKVTPQIVLDRQKIPPARMAALNNGSVFPASTDTPQTVHLTVNGAVIAEGEIIEKDGAYYFRVGKKMGGRNPGKEMNYED